MAGQLTGLHAKFTGDASSLASAARLAAFETNKVNAKLADTKRKAAEAATGSDALAASFHKLKMQTDNTYAGMVRYNKAAVLVNKIAIDQKYSQEQLGAELQRLATHYGVAEAAGYATGNSMKSAGFHTANLGAQFNDIGVMLAAGQNPLMLAVQQGTQISQVLQAAGGTAKETGKLLLASFKSILSPISLATIGIIAVGAALFQFAMSASGAAKEAEILKARQESLAAASDGLTASIKRLREERALDAGVAGSSEELAGQQAIADLLARRAVIEEKLTKGRRETSAWTLGTLGAEQNLLDAELKQIDGKLTLLRYEEKLSIAARGRANEYRDSAAARFQAETETAAAEQKQADLTRLRLNYFHQLAGEYSAVNTTALSMVDAAAKIAASEQQQAELAQLKKNYFHLLAGETSAVSMFLAASSVSAQQLADANLVGPIAAAANTAMTLTQQLGYSYDIVKKLMAGGYEVPGPVIFNPMDPNYDAARAAAAGGLRTQYTPDAPKAESTGGTGGADTFATELEQLQNSLKSQEQLELESYQRRQEVLNTALAQKLLTQQEYAGLIEQSEAQHNFAMLQATNAGVSSTLNSLGQLFEGSKQVSAGIALANSYLAFTEVLKDPSYIGRPFARFAAAAAALSSGLAAVRSIKSAQPGGGGGGGTGSGGSAGGGGATGGAATTSTQVSLQLVGGDLYSRDQVLQLINAINSATADGAQILLR